MTTQTPHPSENRPHHLFFEVNGIPAPQGSKKGFPVRRKNGTIGVALTESAGDKVKTWREDVRAAAEQAAAKAGWTAPHGGVIVDLTFHLPRPKGHYRTGRNAGLLRDSAPTAHIVKPDRDKLERSTHDALTSSGVILDDSNIVGGSVWKAYADGRAPGASIRISSYAHLNTKED